MRGNVHGRLGRLESQLDNEANPHPMSLPLSEEDLAFLDGVELWVDRYPNREDRPLGDALRKAMRQACLAHGLSAEDADGYAEALEHETETERLQGRGGG
jgi:hypothetical protein